MIETVWSTTASRAQVWEVLSDGWLYSSWVVGAARIRDVEAGWPRVGTKIHHSVGAWPVLLNDETQVAESEPLRLLVLTARTRPFGESRVEIELTDGDGQVEITMREDVVRGPARVVPAALRQVGLLPRNRESLRRLAYLAEGR